MSGNARRRRILIALALGIVLLAVSWPLWSGHGAVALAATMSAADGTPQPSPSATLAPVATPAPIPAPTIGPGSAGQIAPLTPSTGMVGLMVAFGCIGGVVGLVIAVIILVVLMRRGYGPFLRSLLLGKRAGANRKANRNAGSGDGRDERGALVRSRSRPGGQGSAFGDAEDDPYAPYSPRAGYDSRDDQRAARAPRGGRQVGGRRDRGDSRR